MTPPGEKPDPSPETAALTPTETATSVVLKGRYLLGPELGRGGFAISYLATDREVASRSVVVKVLNDRRASEAWSLDKFRSEMEALARIDHPNVVGVIDYGESAEGRPFLVMQFVAGRNLRQVIPAEGLPLLDIAAIIQQVGRALSAAHEVGVVHRDVKPDNVMVRQTADGDYHVKLIDFGVAGIREAGSRFLSMNLGGTYSYMAPERFKGESSPASDIYEMGIVAYEMATGRMPFQATSPGGVALMQMEGLEVPPRRLRPDLPEAAEQAILRALAPDPSDRFPTAREFGDELAAALGGGVSASWPRKSATTRGWSAARRKKARYVAVAAAVTTVVLAAAGYLAFRLTVPSLATAAVLPFENRTGESDLAYLPEGITESLINDLSRVPTLRVSGRGAVMKYEGGRVDARAAGRELGVARVIDGSVSKRGGSFYVDAELLDVKTGARLWGNAYSADASSLPEILQQFSSEVTDRLRITLSDPLKERLKRQYAAGSKAYEAYLKGRFHLNKRHTADFAQAVGYFEQAIQADPEYALAHAGLADTYALMAAFGPYYGGAELKFALERARSAAKSALQLDGTLAEGYNAKAMVEVQADYDWQSAEQDYRRSIELNPAFAETHENYALELAGLGRTAEALREVKVAEDLEPGNRHFHAAHGWILYLARRYDESLGVYDALARQPGGAYWVADSLALNYWMKSMPAEARNALQWLPEDAPELRIPFLIAGYARDGQAERAKELLDRYLRGGRVWWYYLAIAHLSLRQPEEAVRDLERAYRERWADVAWIGSEPMFDALRSNPQFRRLIERLKLPSGPGHH